MNVRKKPCKGCEESKQAVAFPALGETGFKQIKGERRIKTVVDKYGIVGVLHLLHLHFAEMHNRTGMKQHKTISVLLREFESIVQRRGTEGATEESILELNDKTKKELAKVGVDWNP